MPQAQFFFQRATFAIDVPERAELGTKKAFVFFVPASSVIDPPFAHLTDNLPAVVRCATNNIFVSVILLTVWL
jgi:hypothetical protein